MKPHNHSKFPIVGIGASAGGLDAYISLFSSMPLDTGMSFVLVQHLDPSHPSLSVEIIARATKLKTEEAKEGTTVKPNHIYVIPPNYNMKISNGVLSLSIRDEEAPQNLAIDLFFKSLANSEEFFAIGVILSGNGNDGSEGLSEIQSVGGLTYAQDPRTAKFQEMPQHAIDMGVVDFILKPQDFADEFSRISKSFLQDKKLTEDTLTKIFDLLLTHSKVNFADYKHTTLKRRIERRMAVRHAKNFQDYLTYLEHHKEEIELLFNDILIHVTEFFREPNSFKALTEKAFPEIMLKKKNNDPIRVWVPGCSTGEEVYSIAICLVEYLKENKKLNPIQLFATDISEDVILKSRTGVYDTDAIKNIPSKFLARYFEKVDNGYKIHKSIRDICLFSKHDLISDPPFSKLDLISCRNVLIYFSNKLQKRLIPIFSYALHTDGILWLGKSESPGEFSKLFNLLDKTYKIYSKSKNLNHTKFHFPLKPISSDNSFTGRKSLPNLSSTDIQKTADLLILSKFCPPSVIINSDLEIIQFKGRLFPFLETVQGKPSMNILKMARPELFLNLGALIQKSKKDNIPLEKKGFQLTTDSNIIHFSIEVVPLNPNVLAKERVYIVFFKKDDLESQQKKQITIKLNSGKSGMIQDHKDERILQLLKELSEIKSYHQSLIEEFEKAQEELTSTNEELQSTNEEFLSANEEIETAKEELESTNEELITVNEELQIRNTDLTTLSNDLNNILSSIEIPVLIISKNRSIRMFSPKAKDLFHLISSDIGRPIRDITSELKANLDEVLGDISTIHTLREVEIQDVKGAWWKLQIRPFLTADNKVEGATIVLIDIDVLKTNEIKANETIEYVTSIADTVPIPLAVVSIDFKFHSVNQSFYKVFSSFKKTLSEDLFSFLNIGSKYTNDLRDLFHLAIKKNESFFNFEIQFQCVDKKTRNMLLSGCKIQWKGAEKEGVLLSFIDITDQRAIEEEKKHLLVREQEARHNSDKANEAKDIFLAILSHELRTPLSSILTWAQLISKGKVDFEKAKEGATVIEQSAKIQSQLIDDLLDISKIIAGKLVLEIKPNSATSIINSAIDSVRSMADKKSITIEPILNTEDEFILGDHVRLQQIVWNLLTNAIKFSPQNTLVTVKLDYVICDDKRVAEIKVTDQGKGISADFLPKIFNQFSQADSSSTRSYGGLGLGLSIVHNLVGLHGGTIKAENVNSGKGAIFTVTLPLLSKDNNVIKPSILNDRKKSDDEESFKDQPNLSRLYVLLIDDDQSTREALSIYLKSFNAEVVALASAADGFTAFKKRQPDVLVSDIAMPNEDGYSLIKKIRGLNIDSGSKTPAIALTAYASPTDAARALSAGFQLHLAKPVNPNDLGRAILTLSKLKV